MSNSVDLPVVSAVAEPAEPVVSDVRRRRFLLAMGLGGAGAAAVALKAAAPVVPAITPDIVAADSAGYRESAHIRNYYRTAKI
jgi:hypothetical protein